MVNWQMKFCFDICSNEHGTRQLTVHEGLLPFTATQKREHVIVDGSLKTYF